MSMSMSMSMSMDMGMGMGMSMSKDERMGEGAGQSTGVAARRQATARSAAQHRCTAPTQVSQGKVIRQTKQKGSLSRSEITVQRANR
jgi:hypothetical protein